ncbi:MAG TPA: DoxX family protein [Xanthobacteraceae bacterium]
MSATLVFPQLGAVYQTLGPWVEALMRVTVALCLVPHGLRIGFGMFPNTGMPLRSMRMLADMLDGAGYRPGRLWAPIIILTEVIGGPLLALGLFTRPVSVPIFILLVMSVVDHKKDGWFWNTLGIEYPLLWATASLYFLVHGGGAVSLDRLIGWEF